MAEVIMEQENKEVERLQGMLSRYCLRLTKSRVEAEDLAQEAWLKAIDSLQPLDHVKPEAYLLRIARNTWIDRVRRQAAQARMMEAVRESAKHYAMPDDSQLGTELAMQAIMTFLSPLQRTVFLLRDVYGYSSQETALMAGLTVGAVKAALHRARAALPLVRQAIEQGTLRVPKDEGLRGVLRALAIAYEAGDIDAMLTLVQQGELEPVPVIAVLQSRRLRASGTSMRGGNTIMLAAA
jgi:RNA polymerase sigma factor, sigma-70 family